ncbi:enoyl-CoA hydratase-related protein [Sphingomonas pokkalii]|uniref:2-(1,2-epoxy-1,2-dihydrophenyl)acetyl-CoA isomerase n=1 Tax=Sphingomonas pokkalii TaxID=2175090 RepID=A0A2U0SII3_9SPHN|nr:enoyl-CoA hydratase-related protein [Sphingomonas pokkalii]PVX31180.1 2-(1,2-epoxy-1,2-dihydrophenyl)acetyl-CoA isomerase [Sphingomonas pokkalii]
MSDAPVLLAMEGDVAVVRLNRPDRLNALTSDMLDLLAATLRQAAADGARAVLLTGEGKGFCAGADLAAGMAIRDSGESLRQHFHPVIMAMADLPIPIVAAVNGPAAGAGASIALAADIVVMARSAYLLLAFANIGLVPDAGATWLVGKSAGRAKLLEMALLGERLPADEALDAGLVTRVADDVVLMETAHGLAAKLAAMPTVALGLIRKQVAAALAGTLAETLEIEAAHQSIASRTEDCREAVAAFLAKRTPQFKGR